jgi:hypothetical protein
MSAFGGARERDRTDSRQQQQSTLNRQHLLASLSVWTMSFLRFEVFGRIAAGNEDVTTWLVIGPICIQMMSDSQ